MENDILFPLLGAMLIPFFLIAILLIVAQWRIYQKAGQPGWACLVPIYNYIVLLRIVNKPMYWILLLFIPLVNIYIAISVVHALSKAFGKDTAFTIGLVLLPFIFYPILAFSSDAVYQGKKEGDLGSEALDQL